MYRGVVVNNRSQRMNNLTRDREKEGGGLPRIRETRIWKKVNNKKEERTREIESHIGADTLPVAMLFVHSHTKRTYSFFAVHTWRFIDV